MPATTKRSTSAAILAIRAKAGNPNTVCPTCGHAPTAPYRVYDERGNVLHGCIDAIHTGRLPWPSASNDWQRKGEPLRHAELAHLRSLSR